MAVINIAKGSENCTMAELLCNIFKTNISSNETKNSIFSSLNTVVYIYLTDVDLSITLEFKEGELNIYEGATREPKIKLKTESSYVIDLSDINIKYGLPWLFDEKGFNILRNIFRSKYKISAKPSELVNILRVTKVISVN
jgi:hypothetical protein